MTQPVAEFIGAKFEVVSVENDRPSDFQGVVFRDKATGDLYLANRGTAPGKSFQDVVDDIDLALRACEIFEKSPANRSTEMTLVR